jgi:hypothetical protein
LRSPAFYGTNEPAVLHPHPLPFMRSEARPRAKIMLDGRIVGMNFEEFAG